MPRGFLTLQDIPVELWPGVWDRTAFLEAERAAGRNATTLAGRTVALVMEKASTRTRVSFEVAAYELGGQAVVLQSEGTQIARGEPISDTARVLASYAHAIVIRTFGQDRVAEMAKWSAVPVINGLSDQHHPCQVATDLYTVRQHFGRIDGLRYAWIGDGNNMAQSWIEAAGMFGLELVLACPEGYAPDPLLVQTARSEQKRLGKGSIELTTDVRAAARGSHVLSTDVWASMGQEAEAAKRRTAFAEFQINAGLVALADPAGIVLHCLPAHRGEEISGDVLDGPRSLVWVQAANRLHIAKALLEYVVVAQHA